MSRDSLNTLIRLALLLSLASSFIGLIIGVFSEEENRKDKQHSLDKENKLNTELDEIRKEINQLKAQLSSHQATKAT